MKLTGSSKALYLLQERFKFRVEGYMFSPAFKRGWDGYIKLIDRNGIVANGLLDNILEYLKEEECEVEFDDSNEFNYTSPYTKDYVMEWIDSYKIKLDDGTEITPYWFQKDAVWEYVSKRRTTLLFPTSAGKSLIQALCVRFFLDHNPENQRVLVIVPKSDLVTQLKDNFLEYGLFSEDEINMVMTGHKVSDSHMVNISTWQSAIKFNKMFFSDIGFIMVDECHNAKATSIQTIVSNAIHCSHRVGLTGTLGEEETEQGKANILQIIGLFGKIFKPVTTVELIEAGLVTDITITNMMLRYGDEFTEKVNALPYQSEIKVLTNHVVRNEFISKFACKLAGRKENVFVMFRYEDHGKLLYNNIKEMAESFGVDPDEVYFINGKIDAITRKFIRKNAEKVNGTIIVASEKTFSEGISINNLHHAIIASPLKSMITVLQTIGRLLRKHKSKKMAYLWDFVDDVALRDKDGKPDMRKMNYALVHGLKRMDYYNSEGFKREVKKIQL